MFIVLEIQTSENGSSAVVPPTTYADINSAMAKFHTILAAAAISSVPYHTAVVLHHSGEVRASECYEHRTEPEEAEE